MSYINIYAGRMKTGELVSMQDTGEKRRFGRLTGETSMDHNGLQLDVQWRDTENGGTYNDWENAVGLEVEAE